MSDQPILSARHTPAEKHVPDAAGIVVFIHGFIGSPRQFDDLLPVVDAAGLSYLALLLPGHGGTGGDFARAGMQAWQAHVTQTLQSMKNRYDKVYVVGHSMGGLLATHAWRQQPDLLAGLLCLAPPLRLTISLRTIKRACLMVFAPGKMEASAEKRAFALCGVQPGPVLAYLRWLPKALQLQALSKRERALLADAPGPLCLCFRPGMKACPIAASKGCIKGAAFPPCIRSIIWPIHRILNTARMI